MCWSLHICSKKKGYDVVIAVYEEVLSTSAGVGRGITVIECQKEALKEMEFEIVFIQHFPAFDYLVRLVRIKI